MSLNDITSVKYSTFIISICIYNMKRNSNTYAVIVFLKVALLRCPETSSCCGVCAVAALHIPAAFDTLPNGPALSSRASWGTLNMWLGKKKNKTFQRTDTKSSAPPRLQPSATVELCLGAATCLKPNCPWFHFPRYGIWNFNNFVSNGGRGVVFQPQGNFPALRVGAIPNKNGNHLRCPPIPQRLHRFGAPSGRGYCHVPRALFHTQEQPALQQHQPAPGSVCPRPPRSRQVRTQACPLSCLTAGPGFTKWGKKEGFQARSS